MTAQIQAGDIANPAFVLVSVFTPQPGGGLAQPALQFTIAPVTNPIPHITSISPQGVFTGSGNVAVDVTGTNFVAQSQVTVNGNNIQTIYVNSTALVAGVPAANVANSGTLQISVVNPPQNTNPNIPPGGGSSNIVNLNVTNPVPAISSVSPIAIGAGTASSSLSVAGSNFVPNSVILVNGSARATVFGGSSQLQAQLTASDLAAAGANQVQVVNPAPGGGTSTSMAFAVTPSITAGLPVLVDVGFDGSQANNGICGGPTTCQNASLGLIPGLTPLISSGPSVSSSGELLAFASVSNNLVSGQKSTGSQIFLRDTCLTSTTSSGCTPVTSLLTGAPAGGAANGPSSQPSVDSTGTLVAFTSMATNLIATMPVPTGTSQVYWTPSCTTAVITSAGGCAAVAGASPGTIIVSASADGLGAGDGNSYNPVLSPDGQFVAFVSLATNLVANLPVKPDGITPQIYVHTMCNPTTSGGVTTTTCTPTTYLVSSPDGTTLANGASSQPSIAGIGKAISFTSSATNLGPSAPNPSARQEIFEQTECYGASSCVQTTNLISTPDAGATAADGASTESSISDNGRFVAFASTATTLIPGIGPLQQIYLYDTCMGAASGTTCTPSVKLVSTRDGAAPANALARNPSINRCGSATNCVTGQFVAFSSKASNLGPNVANGIENIFVRNTCAGVAGTTTTCTPATAVASQTGGPAPLPSNGDSLVPAISGDGHTVGFLSYSNNLVPRDSNNVEDIFLGSTSF